MLLFFFSITPISGQIAYPDRYRARRGQMTEVGLYDIRFIFLVVLLHVKLPFGNYSSLGNMVCENISKLS